MFFQQQYHKNNLYTLSKYYYKYKNILKNKIEIKIIKSMIWFNHLLN